MKLLVFAVVIASLVTSCTNPESATRVLKANGFTNIRMTGYQFWACSEHDTYHTGFKATSPNGTEVEGCVCEGLLFKNSTIRFK